MDTIMLKRAVSKLLKSKESMSDEIPVHVVLLDLIHIYPVPSGINTPK